MRAVALTRSIGSYVHKRLVEEGQKRNIDLKVINYSHIHFHLEKGEMKVNCIEGEDLSTFDIVIPRSPGLERRYGWHERILFDWMHDKGKRILNYESLKKYQGDFDKLLQNFVFLKAGIPFVPTDNYGFRGFFPDRLPEYPFIVKPAMGSLGRDFKLVENSQDIEEFFTEKHPYNFIAQPFLPTGEDYRVIILGDEVLGAMKRISPGKGQPTNASAGGIVEKVELSKELYELAKRAADVMACEYCGVDIMLDKAGNPYVLEVNRYGMFRAFEEVTGINVAGKMLDYLVETRNK